MKRTPLCVCVLALFSSIVVAQGDPGPLLRQPALGRTQIAFACAGDIWIAAREGGEARRLTSGARVVHGPMFSPDGSTLAFTGEYDGNTDVYIIPAAGGTPRR